MRFFQRFRKKRRGPLANEPGPSPWYLAGQLSGVSRNGGALAWRPAGETPTRQGKTLLTDEAGGALLVLDFYCWVRPLGGSRLLVWHQTKRAVVERGAEPAMVHLHALDLDAVRPIWDVERACRNLDGSTESLFCDGGEIDCCRVSTSQEPGTHRLSVPEALSEIHELLVLVDSSQPPHSPSIHLWILRPADGTLDVVPQDWFNKGSFDFGYEWITRIARDSRTGALVGEGVRLRPFELDDSGTQIRRWLTVNPFEVGSR